MPMVLDVSLDGLTGDPVSHGPGKVPTFRELSAPELPLHLGEPSEDLFCADCLENPHHLPNRIPRRHAGEDADMIRGDLHLLNLAVPRSQDLLKQLPCCISDLFSQDPLAILWRPHQVVSRIVHRMAHPFEAHAAYYTPCSKRGHPFLPVLPYGVSRVGIS